MKIEKYLPTIQKNISLKNYTTFKIGGPAKYFFVAKTKKDLIKAITVARKLDLPFFILGGGSNLLVSDEGYEGLIIKIQNTKYKILTTKAYAEAGTLLFSLVRESVRNNLTGLEWAAGIPGTVGGAIYGNAGAFNHSLSESVQSVEVLEISSGNQRAKSKNQNDNFKVKTFRNKDCKFDYRDSIFKHKKNLIILSSILQLKKGNKKKIENEIKKNLKQKRETQPLNFPSAGSIFKNPPSLPAGYLIEACNLKGRKIGNIKISEKHTNFIINLGDGKAKDVKKLIKLIKRKVKKKFNTKLEEEIQYLGL